MAGKIQEHLMKLDEAVPEETKPKVKELVGHVLARMKDTEVSSMRSRPDYKFFAPFNPDVVEWEWDNWAPRKGDVLIVSYPKTGTTWLREVSRQIKYFGDEKLLEISKALEMPFLSYLEAGNSAKFEVVDSLPMDTRVWATHLPSELVPIERILKLGVKIVYISRNPKDMIISMKKFFESIPWMQAPGIKQYFPDDTQEFATKCASGEMPMQMKMGEWYPHHIRSWLKYKDLPGVHFMSFEKMKQDPKGEILSLSKFYEVDLTDEQIEHVAKVTSFDSMKKNTELLGKNQPVVLFRKGGVGNWKKHLTVETSEFVDLKMKEDLGDDWNKIDFVYSL